MIFLNRFQSQANFYNASILERIERGSVAEQIISPYSMVLPLSTYSRGKLCDTRKQEAEHSSRTKKPRTNSSASNNPCNQENNIKLCPKCKTINLIELYFTEQDTLCDFCIHCNYKKNKEEKINE